MLLHIVVLLNSERVVSMASMSISVSVVDLVGILTSGEPKIVLSIPMVDTLFSVPMADGTTPQDWRDH